MSARVFNRCCKDERIGPGSYAYGRILDLLRVQLGGQSHRLAVVEIYCKAFLDKPSGGYLRYVNTMPAKCRSLRVVRCEDIGKRVALCPQFQFARKGGVQFARYKHVVLGGTRY
jgi:hypothetical protein